VVVPGPAAARIIFYSFLIDALAPAIGPAALPLHICVY